MRPVVAVCLGIWGMGMGMPSAFADTFQHSFVANIGSDYDSNPTMLSGSHSSVMRYRLAPQYSARHLGDVDEFTFSLGMLFERSSDSKLSLDRNDPNIRLGWRRLLESGEFSINASANKASARTTELSENGLVAADTTQTNKLLGARWQYGLTDRVAVVLTGDYRNVTNDKGNSGYNTLTDYTTMATGVTTSYSLDDNDEVYVSLTASHYEPESTTISSSNTYGGVLGYKQKLSESFDWSLQAGPVRITGTNGGSSWQGNGQLNYTGERVSAGLDIGRNVLASSVTGGFANSDQVRSRFSYQIDEKTKAGMDLSWIKNNTVVSSTTQVYGVFVSKELSPYWSLMLRYQDKQVDRAQGAASANIIGLTLTYSHPDL